MTHYTTCDTDTHAHTHIPTTTHRDGFRTTHVGEIVFSKATIEKFEDNENVLKKVFNAATDNVHVRFVVSFFFFSPSCLVIVIFVLRKQSSHNLYKQHTNTKIVNFIIVIIGIY